MQFITEEEKRRMHMEVDKIMTEEDFLDDMKRIEKEIANGEYYTEEEFKQRVENRSRICR